jgi:hypothetical protein
MGPLELEDVEGRKGALIELHRGFQGEPERRLG